MPKKRSQPKSVTPPRPEGTGDVPVEIPTPSIVVRFQEISVNQAYAVDPKKLLRQLRDVAVELSNVIVFWRLEGTTHLNPGRDAALGACWQVEWREHALSQRLLDVPRTANRNGVHSVPVLNLAGDELFYARAAIGLLDDAVSGIYSGISYERRRTDGMTSVSPDVCKQLRHAVDLLDFILKPRTSKGKRRTDDRKRQLINDAFDQGITARKNIQEYVSGQLRTKQKVSPKMISEVKAFRESQRRR